MSFKKPLIVLAATALWSATACASAQTTPTPTLDPALGVPLDAADWIRPADLEARFRWDVLCRVADGLVPWFPEGAAHTPGDSERLETALADTVARLGRTEEEVAAEWSSWGAMAMTLSHDRQVIPHPLIPGIHRACVEQVAGAGQPPDGSSSPTNRR